MFVVLAILAAAAQGVTASPDPKTDDPIVCTVQHSGDEVGTRIQPKKLCMKKSERDAMQKIEDQNVQQYINSGNDRMRSATKPR